MTEMVFHSISTVYGNFVKRSAIQIDDILLYYYFIDS